MLRQAQHERERGFTAENTESAEWRGRRGLGDNY